MYPQAYLKFLFHFHTDRDYFECHEILEEYWKSTPHRDKVWVGLIQIAVSLYHWRRNNFAGAEKMMHSAIRILDAHRNQLDALGLDADRLFPCLERRLMEIQERHPYASMNLPIQDPTLQETLQATISASGAMYGTPSDMNNRYLLHKHTLRDRSGVIREREAEIKKRKAKGIPPAIREETGGSSSL